MWGVVAYVAIGLVVFAVCMATGSGIVRDIYNGNYPEDAGAGLVAISCILFVGIIAGAMWPIAIVAFAIITTIEKMK